MDGSSSALDSDVTAEVKVKLERMSAASLDQGSRKRVVVAITLADVREEANVVALAGDDDSELGQLLAAELLEALLHIADFLFKHGGVLTVEMLA
jgi:hydroxypyruvate isomerase